MKFSPKSLAILEIQSKRDLEILEKIYADSALLGSDDQADWGIKYGSEFHMTNDSKLFPPKTKWEQWGYKPDEYGRWLKGEWKSIESLWPEIHAEGVQSSSSAEELEDWLFDDSATPERRTSESCFIHGHLLKPGDVAVRELWIVDIT